MMSSPQNNNNLGKNEATKTQGEIYFKVKLHAKKYTENINADGHSDLIKWQTRGRGSRGVTERFWNDKSSHSIVNICRVSVLDTEMRKTAIEYPRNCYILKEKKNKT